MTRVHEAPALRRVLALPGREVQDETGHSTQRFAPWQEETWAVTLLWPQFWDLDLDWLSTCFSTWSVSAWGPVPGK